MEEYSTFSNNICISRHNQNYKLQIKIYINVKKTAEC